MSDGKTIWILNSLSYLPEDGPHIRHYCFGKYLAREGYKVTVFASNQMHHTMKEIDTEGKPYKLKSVDGVSFAYVKTVRYKKNDIKRVINIASYYFQVLRVANAYARAYGKPDIIYASTLYPTAIMAGQRLARRYGVRCVCETRDIWPEGLIAYGGTSERHPVAILLRAFMKKLYEKSFSLVFTMEGGLQYLRDMGWTKSSGGKICDEKVVHINNGVDLDLFDENQKKYVLDDADLANKDIFKVVYTGAIRFLDKTNLLIDAAVLLKEKGIHDVRILLWGDGNYLEPMRARVREEGLDNIEYKGRANKSFVASIVSRADLNVIVGDGVEYFKYGHSKNKAFDYLAAGKPVLVTCRIGYSNIEPRGAGMEMENNSAEAIVDAILYFKKLREQNSDAYDAYCKNARCVAEEYDYKVLTERLKNEVLLPAIRG